MSTQPVSTFETEEIITAENEYTYKYTHTWQPTTNTLNPQLTNTKKYIEYYPGTWTQLKEKKYQNGLLHSNTHPSIAEQIYTEDTHWEPYDPTTPEQKPDYTYETTTRQYHYYGLPLQQALEFAHKQGTITQQQYDNLTQAHHELLETIQDINNHDTAKQQQIYDTLDNL